MQDCRRSAMALTRNKRDVGVTNEPSLTTSDDELHTKIFRDANSSLTVWYPSELLDRHYRLSTTSSSQSVNQSRKTHLYSVARHSESDAHTQFKSSTRLVHLIYRHVTLINQSVSHSFVHFTLFSAPVKCRHSQSKIAISL